MKETELFSTIFAQLPTDLKVRLVDIKQNQPQFYENLKNLEMLFTLFDLFGYKLEVKVTKT